MLVAVALLDHEVEGLVDIDNRVALLLLLLEQSYDAVSFEAHLRKLTLHEDELLIPGLHPLLNIRELLHDFLNIIRLSSYLVLKIILVPMGCLLI